MRAGVLSDEQVITFLNEHFINTWVPNAELGRIRSLREPIQNRRLQEGKTFNKNHELAQTIIKGWKTGTKKGSPVDCFVISPEIELMGRQLVNDLDDDRRNRALPSEEAYYLTFLNDALDGKQPGLGNVVLTYEHPLHELSDVIRTPSENNQNLNVIMIDARPCKNGGILIIDILMGRDDAEGAFYLCDGDYILPTDREVLEDDSLAWTWGESGETLQIKHRCDSGQLFKLIATRYWDEDIPYINSFHAKISVEENTSTGMKIVLDKEQPKQKVLDTFRAPGHGNQNYTVVNIDTLAFDNGGILSIRIQVGNAKARGSFDLFDSDTKLPTKGTPKETLSSAWGIEPGNKGQLTHRFEKGKVFKLGATGDWYSKKGDINAFHAIISVKESK